MPPRILAFTRPGDVVFELDGTSGGHRLAEKLNATHYAALQVHGLPFDPVVYNVDVDQTVDLAHRLHPRLIILGSSLFLFPHPVAELASALRDLPDTLLALRRLPRAGPHCRGGVPGSPRRGGRDRVGEHPARASQGRREGLS